MQVTESAISHHPDHAASNADEFLKIPKATHETTTVLAGLVTTVLAKMDHFK